MANQTASYQATPLHFVALLLKDQQTNEVQKMIFSSRQKHL